MQLEIRSLTKTFGDRTILADLSLTIARGDRLALIGGNGSGKSTLLRLITGEIEPDAGRLSLGPSVRWAFLPQTIVFPNPDQPVLDTVRYELNCSEAAARHRLAAFHFPGDTVFKPVGALSGGEKSRLRLCLIMQQDINLLILDEPTNHLDIASREWIEAAVDEFSGTVLFVSHDRYFIRRFAESIWELADTRIISFAGTYDDYREWRRRSAPALPPQPTPSAAKSESARTKEPSRSKETAKGNDRRQREIQALEEQILDLEAKLTAVEAEMAAAESDYGRLEPLYREQTRLKAEIGRLYEQWGNLTGDEA